MSRCVVVGGGIVGASAAYHLAEAGEDVVLVDRADPGHATAAGAGIVAPGLSTALPPAWEPLAFRAVAYYPELLAALHARGRDSIEYAVVGALHVAATGEAKARLPEAHALFAGRGAAGVENIGELSLVSGAAMRELFPPLDEAHEAVHATGAARVDGRSLRDALLGAFESAGGERRHGSAGVLMNGSAVAGVRLDGETIAADRVVLATGAWADAVADVAGSDLGIEPQRGQILHLEVPGTDTSRWPILLGLEGYYVLTFPPNRVVVGATREPGTGFDRRVTVAGQRELVRRALAYAPGLADATVVETKVGFRPVVADGLPLIGPLPGCDGAFVATGLGPVGLTLGPYTGALVAELARGREPSLDVTAFAPGRR